MTTNPWERDFPLAAGPEDILAAFRLILGRLPGREEWAGHSSLAGQPLVDVVRPYLNSAEFKARNLLDVPMRPGIVERHNGRFVVVADENDPQLGGPALNGAYEPEVARTLESLLKEGDHFLDVGANLGYFSLLAATLVGASGRVYAIEPNEYNIKLLERSRRANRFDNISIMQVGASDEAEVLFLHATIGNGSTSSVRDEDNLFASRTIPGVPLDNLLAYREKPVRLIKIDVEGFEHKALQGARRILEEDKPDIIFEFQGGGLADISARDFLQFLKDKGYEFVSLSSGRDLSDYQSIDEIMTDFERSGVDHIDVLAKSSRSNPV